MKRDESTAGHKTRLTRLSRNTVRALASAVGLAIPDEDLEPLLSALEGHLTSMAQLDELDARDSEPINVLDPRWT